MNSIGTHPAKARLYSPADRPSHHLGAVRGTAAKVPALGLALVLIQGCVAVMSQTDCVNADWYALGEFDGSQGLTMEMLARRDEACGAYGITPDGDAYRSGRDSGIERFCAPENGYRHGHRGQSYAGVCPARLEPDFLEAYNAGRDIFVAAEEVERIDFEIESLRSQREDLERSISGIEGELAEGTVDDETRAELTARAAEYRERITRIDAAVDRVSGQRERALERYHDTRENNAAIGFYEVSRF